MSVRSLLPAPAEGALTTPARQLAALLLGVTSNRWRHSAGVAERAGELADRLGLDREILVAAAWLHDIGYAEPLVDTGFHPLDGALHLSRSGWSARIAGLVAHHSGARFVAAARGLATALAEFPDERSLLADALTYADQTVGPCGDRVDMDERYVEMLRRQGPQSWNARVDGERRPHLQAIAARIQPLLAFA